MIKTNVAIPFAGRNGRVLFFVGTQQILQNSVYVMRLDLERWKKDKAQSAMARKKVFRIMGHEERAV